jgi:hypothetical protein
MFLEHLPQAGHDLNQATGMRPVRRARHGAMNQCLRNRFGHANDAVTSAAQGRVYAQNNCSRSFGLRGQGSLEDRPGHAAWRFEPILHLLELLWRNAHAGKLCQRANSRKSRILRVA